MSESIVNAIVVGDGFVDIKGRLRFKHSIAQKEYALSKASILETNGFKVSVREFVDGSGYNLHESKRFIEVSTTATSRGKQMRRFFYPDGVKIIPDSVASEFGWAEWAIIYQDDGRANRLSHYNTIIGGQRTRVNCEPYVNRYEIAVPQLRVQDHNELLDSLLALGVEASIHERSDRQLRICISRSQSKITFYEGIKPHVHRSMLYKVQYIPALSYSR